MTSPGGVTHRGGSLLALVPLLAALAACGSAASPSPSPSPATVEVTLQEWAIVPGAASAPAGSVTFRATNTGPNDPHELVIFKTDLGHRDLPTRDDGGVDEEGAGVELIGEIEEFDVGGSESATFTLTAGKYVFVCNLVEEEDEGLESHYQEGMSIEFTVE